MNDRMDKFETAMDENIERGKEIKILKKNQTKIREQLRKEQENRVLKFKKDTGMITEKETAAKTDDKNTNDKDKNTNDKDSNSESIEDLMSKTNDSFSPDWARRLSGQLALDAEQDKSVKKRKNEKEIKETGTK